MGWCTTLGKVPVPFDHKCLTTNILVFELADKSSAQLMGSDVQQASL
jgi:hypothetical protein